MRIQEVQEGGGHHPLRLPRPRRSPAVLRQGPPPQSRQAGRLRGDGGDNRQVRLRRRGARSAEGAATEGGGSGAAGEEVGAAQPEAPPIEEEAAARPRRWGDGRVVIAEVELLDKFGARCERFSSFDPMTVRIRYHAKERINDPIFGIALYDDMGRHLYGTNTELKDHPIESVQGEGKVDLLVSRIPMLSGKFFLTVAAHTRDGKPYDWVDK